ncbi:MAG: ABC transporter ATP-binding protein/permease [Lachnospiraceae bacterium]|jgi:ABC-type multidrug transport system fused ATPase/permease subunit|nr:ABC transporter ATP-binding protein/permease [Lachnospiraceae bacterium]
MDELRKLNYIFTKKQKQESLRLFFIIVIGTVFELLGVSTVMPVINAITDPQKLLQKPMYRAVYDGLGLKNTTQLILLLIGLLIAVYLIKNFYLIFMYRQQYKYIYSNMRMLSTKMMRCYLDQPYSFHTRKNSSELLRNINQDTADFFGTIQAFVLLFTESLVVAVLVIYLAIKDKSITAAVGVIMLILILLFRKTYKTRLLKMGEKNRHYEAEVNKWVQQAFGGIKEVKVMNKEDFFYDRYDAAYQGRVRSEYTYHTMTTLPKPVIEAACMCSLLGAIAIKLMRGVDPTYFVPTISIFAVAAYRLLPSFNRITEYMGTIAYQKPAINAIYKDLKEIDELNARKKEEGADDGQKLSLNACIRISHLSFHYPDSEKKILDDVSFDIPKNISVAFIGKSGAGKTTLADLIMGVLDPTGGEILADGTPILAHLRAWHHTIGYIPQNIYLMDDTIANNITFGVPSGDVDEKKLRRAVERAQLSDFIRELPDGLETPVGERGVRLSGGQRQRIAIARALYNEPDVLILDEATSALDNETEKAVMDAIDALHGEMTLIIIAHRLSTIQNCDVIYTIGDGRAVPGKADA